MPLNVLALTEKKSGKKRLVNLGNIEFVEVGAEGEGCLITMNSGKAIEVAETIQRIEERANSRPPDGF